MKQFFSILTLLLLFSVTALAQMEGVAETLTPAQQSQAAELKVEIAEQDSLIAKLEAEIAREQAKVIEQKTQLQSYIDTLSQDVALSAPYSFAQAERIAADPNATDREKYLATVASKRRSGHMKALLSDESSVPVDTFMVMLEKATSSQIQLNIYLSDQIGLIEEESYGSSKSYLARLTMKIVGRRSVNASQYNASGYGTQLPDAPAGCYEIGADREFALLMYYEDTCKSTAELVEAVQAYLKQ